MKLTRQQEILLGIINAYFEDLIYYMKHDIVFSAEKMKLNCINDVKDFFKKEGLYKTTLLEKV